MDTLPRGERRRPDIVTDLRGTLIDLLITTVVVILLLLLLLLAMMIVNVIFTVIVIDQNFRG